MPCRSGRTKGEQLASNIEFGWHAHVQEGTGKHALHGGRHVGISTHDGAVLPSKLHQTRLQVLPARPRDLAAYRRAAGEVDLADGRVLDHGVDYLGGVLRATVQDVEAAGGQTGVFKRAADGPVTARGQLGGFQDGGVTGSESACSGSDTEDVGCVPVELALYAQQLNMYEPTTAQYRE